MAKPTVLHLVTRAVEMGASDIHITVNRPPTYRIHGSLYSDPDFEDLTSADAQALGMEIIPNERVLNDLRQKGQADFSNSYAGIGRFRVNVYQQRGSWAIAIRLIPIDVPELEDLGLPPVVDELAMRETGLILVTGITGSGKSTTLAGMLNLVNQKKSGTIITLEDPIEYLHRHRRCIINQREIGSDTDSFANGLRAALRQDPDVILVGEMRDLETISTAITAAETGHLVLATLHSGNAVSTVERIIDVFPPHQQVQVRIQLANCLQGIISQQLVPRCDISGRVLACEVMVITPAIRNLIRENKGHQIYSSIQTGSQAGMQTMERSLKALLARGMISNEEASKRMITLEG